LTLPTLANPPDSFSSSQWNVQTPGLVEEVLMGGSFVGARPDPNDIDLVVVVRADHDFSADLPPSQYNVLTQKRVRKRFGLI
jgi:Family of unknown function (DUF6932)